MSPAGIHSMPRQDAALARPVKVRGVVTFAYPESIGEFVLGDASGGLYVTMGGSDWTGSLPTVGSLVEVTGVTAATGYAPVVSARTGVGPVAGEPSRPAHGGIGRRDTRAP